MKKTALPVPARVTAAAFVGTLLIGTGVVALSVFGSAGLLLLVASGFGGSAPAAITWSTVVLAALAAVLALWRALKLFGRAALRVVHGAGISTPLVLVAALMGTALGVGIAAAITPDSWLRAALQMMSGRHPADSPPLPSTGAQRAWMLGYVEPRAAAGDGFAAFLLSEAYRQGSMGRERDTGLAARWNQAALQAGDFDARLAAAVESRHPDAPRFGHVPAPYEREYKAAAVHALIEAAPQTRRASIAMLAADLSSRTADMAVNADASARGLLKEAAALGSRIAAVRLAQSLEIRGDLRDAAEVQALYAWARARYESERVWRRMDEDSRAEAQRRLAAFKAGFRSPALPDTALALHLIERARVRSAGGRSAATTGDQRTDARVHDLAAIELSGWRLESDQDRPLADTLLKINSPLSRYLLDQQAQTGDCPAHDLLAWSIESMEPTNLMQAQPQPAQASDEPPPDRIWSIALYRLAAACTKDPSRKAQAQSAAERVTATLPPDSAEAITTRMDTLRPRER